MDVELARAIFSDVGELYYCKKDGWVLRNGDDTIETYGKKKDMVLAAKMHAGRRSVPGGELRHCRHRICELNLVLSDLIAEKDRMVIATRDPRSPEYESMAMSNARSEILRLKATLAEATSLRRD